MVMLLEVPLFLVIIIDLGSARAINGANKLQLSAELDPSELQGTLCNDNKVKVICYMRRNNGQNVLLNHLNCKWTCTRGINNQKEGMTILSYEPMYILSKNLEVPAQCKCSCKDPQGGEDKTAYLNISGHGPPIIKIHHSIPPVEGNSYTINATITTDIPFTSDGYPAWESLSSRWIDSSSYENQTYFMELSTLSFSAATDGGKYTITAANECGKSSGSILIGVKNDLTPSPSSKDDSTPYPDGHGKGPLEDIIIVISVVIIITISVIISVGLSWKRGKNNRTVSGESGGTLQGITEGGPAQNYGATGNTEGCNLIFSLIGTFFKRNVNLDSLVPMLIKHHLIPEDNVQDIVDPNSVPSSRIQQLLDHLTKQGNECLKLLLCSLNSATEHAGHSDIARKLEELMKDKNIEYDNNCPICKKAIN